LTESAASAIVPQLLLESTVLTGSAVAGIVSPGAGALSEGVLRTMFVTRMKITRAIALVASTVFVGLASAGPNAAPDQKDQLAPAAGGKDSKKGEPRKAETDRKLKPFTKIHLKEGTAIIRQADRDSAEIPLQGLFNDRATIEVEDGTLILSGFGVEFVVGVKDLTTLTAEGLGTAELKDFKARRLEIKIDGGAKVLASGTVTEQVITVSGLGTFTGKACAAETAHVRVDGQGKAVVNVSKKLKAKITVFGRITYLGKPQIEEDVSESGRLEQGVFELWEGGIAGFGGFDFSGIPGCRGVNSPGHPALPGLPLSPHEFLEARLGSRVEAPGPTLREQLGLPDKQGLVVTAVFTGADDEIAGLKIHDILLEFDGKPVPSDGKELLSVVSALKPTQKFSATVLRKGRKQTIKGLGLLEGQNQLPWFQSRPVPPPPGPQLPVPNANPDVKGPR
jgi:hypothetical protein